MEYPSHFYLSDWLLERSFGTARVCYAFLHGQKTFLEICVHYSHGYLLQVIPCQLSSYSNAASERPLSFLRSSHMAIP